MNIKDWKRASLQWKHTAYCSAVWGMCCLSGAEVSGKDWPYLCTLLMLSLLLLSKNSNNGPKIM